MAFNVALLLLPCITCTAFTKGDNYSSAKDIKKPQNNNKAWSKSSISLTQDFIR